MIGPLTKKQMSQKKRSERYRKKHKERIKARTRELYALNIKEKRKEFILRLKSAGENSSPVLHLQSAMTELKMNQAPRGVTEQSTMQHMFSYETVDNLRCYHQL